MAQTDYLFNTENKEESFNNIIEFLKSEGYSWVGNIITFKEAKELYFKDKRKTMLIRAFHNRINNKNEIQLTYLSQYNHMREILDEETIYMKNIETMKGGF